MTFESRILELYSCVVERHVYDPDFCRRHITSIQSSKVKTKDMPKMFYDFVKNYSVADEFHLTMFMIHILKEAGIKSYLAVTKENDSTHVLHYSVLIQDEKRKKFFISDPGEDLKNDSLYARAFVPVKEFKKLSYKGRIRVYDMYGKHKDKCFFDDGYRKDCEIDLL